MPNINIVFQDLRWHVPFGSHSVAVGDIHCVLRGVMPHGKAQISNATRSCGAQQQKDILLPTALHCIATIAYCKIGCLFVCLFVLT